MSTVTLNLEGSPQGVADLLAAIFLGPDPVIPATLPDSPREPFTLRAKPDATPPAIGEPWPGQGGLYAGLSRGVDGQADAHLILALDAFDGDKNWDEAVAWAQGVSVDGHQDFRLPTRAESALLFANLKDKCEARWHWTGEQYSRTYAWSQTFGGGYQDGYGKSYGGRARAVRRFIP